MTRRGELKDFAAGLLGSFVSRNNDAGGYWGLGLLRSLADRRGMNLLLFDLKAGSAEPQDPTALRIAQAYRDKLGHHLARRRIPSGVVVRAEITVEFGLEAPVTPAPTYGQPVRGTALLVDPRNREHRRSALTTCAPHDPARESRSARAGTGRV
jgi:hypothetical protein